MINLKRIINPWIYRITGRSLQKITNPPNWNTIHSIDAKSPKTIFGYKLDYPFPHKKWWENPVFPQKQNKAKKTRPLLVVGQGWTGSSAVVDYLREFRGVLPYGSEFRLLKDPGGIIELESALIDHWTYWNSSVAIKRFIQLAEMHARKNRFKFMGEFLQTGFDSEKFTNGNFMRITEEYIDNLAFLRFPGNWFMDDCGKPPLRILLDNIKRKLEYSKEEFFMIHPERDRFIKATQKYTNAIIDHFNIWANLNSKSKDDRSNIDWVIFDQAIWPQAYSKALDYFDNAKIIVVERDPRDVYMSASGLMSGSPVAKHRSYCPNDPKTFAEYYRKLMENSRIEEHPALLRISFEDFNLKHEKTSALVRDFLNLDLEDHLIPDTFYKRKVSATRVGKWRNSSPNVTDAIRIISDMLPEYCYPVNI